MCTLKESKQTKDDQNTKKQSYQNEMNKKRENFNWQLVFSIWFLVTGRSNWKNNSHNINIVYIKEVGGRDKEVFYASFLSTDELSKCGKTGFNIDEKIEVQVESSDDNKFCPKQIFVWFAKKEEFHTKHINYDFKDYSDESQRQWHKLVKKRHH